MRMVIRTLQPPDAAEELTGTPVSPQKCSIEEVGTIPRGELKMIRFATATAALLATTAVVHAGDIGRTDQSVRLLFEQVGENNTYFELSFGYVDPTAGADGVTDPLGDFVVPGFGLLYRATDKISFSVNYDTPFGADTGFAAGAPFFGGFAEIDTDALTVLARYEFGGGFSAHGGFRALSAGGQITTLVAPPLFTNLVADSDTGFGYVIGGAYEIPEIALRVALTYNSTIDLDFNGVETPIIPPTGAPAGAPTPTEFTVEFPDSINLEVQSGIAEDTLAFGSIRHVFFDGFSLATPTGQFVNFTSDSTTVVLGVGRRFSEQWSGQVSYTYRSEGTIPSDTALSPTTGLNAITVGARFDQPAYSISGGVTYGIPGDQIVENAIAGPQNFDDNEVVAVGLRVGFRF